MTAPKVIWVEPSIAVAGTHGSTAWPDRDDDCISYLNLKAPELVALVATMRKMHEGWSNALELGLIPDRHRLSAQILRDDAAAALAAWEALK